MRITLSLMLFLVLAINALASEPGQPLDCGDWEFMVPGLSCTVVVGPPCESPFCKGWGPSAPSGSALVDVDRPGSTRAVDNEGGIYLVRRIELGNCVGSGPQYRVEMRRLVDGSGFRII